MKDRLYCVYWLHDDTCVDPLVDGYIGVTYQLRSRFNAHKRAGRFSLGVRVSVIFDGTQPQCMEREIQLRPKSGIGWNRARGGPNGYRYGHTPETRHKMSLAAKRLVRSESHLQNIAAANKVRMSDETRRKLSEAKKGRPSSLSMAAREKLSRAMKGRTFSVVTREKIAEANRRRTQSIETRVRLREINLGKRHSPETRMMMSLVRKGKPGRPRSVETRMKISATRRANFAKLAIEKAAQ